MTAETTEKTRLIRAGTLADSSGKRRMETIWKSPNVELIRLVLPAGMELPPHQAPGELVVQCIQGRVAFSMGETVSELQTGDLMVLPEGTQHGVTALDDCVALLTICREPRAEFSDLVDETSDESFPASDAPAWTGSAAG